MLQVFLLALPEIRSGNRSGKNAGDHERFVDLIQDSQKLLLFLYEGKLVFDCSLTSGSVVRFGHVPARGLVADALSCADKPLLQLDKGRGIRRLSCGIDHRHIVSGI